MVLRSSNRYHVGDSFVRHREGVNGPSLIYSPKRCHAANLIARDAYGVPERDVTVLHSRASFGKGGGYASAQPNFSPGRPLRHL